MIRIKNLVGRDRISIGLLATALSSLLVALTVAATPSSASIPERLLDRVHGANPAFYRYPDTNFPNCNTLEVAWLSQDSVTAVPWNGCTLANLGTMCIECAQQYNYDLKIGTGNPDVYPRPIGEASCNAPDGSSSGQCDVDEDGPYCDLTDGLTCAPSATTYITE